MMFTPFTHTAQATEQENYTKLVQTAIEEASNYIKKNGVDSEWEAIGLAKAGKNVPEDYNEVFDRHIQSQVQRGLENGRIKITDIERLAIAAVAIGKDPTKIFVKDGENEKHLIELIYNSPERNGGYDTMTFQGNNGPIFALIALDTKGFAVPEDAKWTRQKLIDELLRTQNGDGSWPLNEQYNTPSIDITAMALIGLGPYKNQPKVKEALDNAVDYLASVQTDDGGFDGGSFVGGITSEAASQVIIGLSTYGIDPRKFATEEGINVLEHLLEYQNEDGGFKHTDDYDYSDPMATEQALQALVAFQLFVNGEGPLYRFDKKEAQPENPNLDDAKPPADDEKPNNSKPSTGKEGGSKSPVKNENPSKQKPTVENKSQNNSNTFDGTKGIEKGKKVEVKQGEKINIQGSNVDLQLPHDLPDGTRLTVTNSTIKEYGGLKPAGDILEFTFEYPNGESGEGFYILTFKVDSGVDIHKAGVYHFNEEKGEWEYIPGEINAEERTITVKVDHFSTYGVFTHNEENGKPLPKTATESYNLLLIGLVLFAIGGSFLIYQWRRKQLVK